MLGPHPRSDKQRADLRLRIRCMPRSGGIDGVLPWPEINTLHGSVLTFLTPVSYTHLTLPTIYSV